MSDIELYILNEHPLNDYREACLITQGKTHIKSEITNEYDFWYRHIRAMHSTLRCVRFRIKMQAPRSVIMQLVRHTKGHPQFEVQSSRPDWTGKPRSSDPYELKWFIQDHTAESWIELCKLRLCQRTEVNTRNTVANIVEEMRKTDVPFFMALAEQCKPRCSYKGRNCPELQPCGIFGYRVEK